MNINNEAWEQLQQRLAVIDEQANKKQVDYKNAALLGDSIIGQHNSNGGGNHISGSQGFWNWSNWMVGSPFHFVQNLGLSGDVSASIFSRIWQIHSHIDTVFVLAGTNDVNNFSSSATDVQLATEVDRLIGPNGTFTLGLLRMKAAGKNVCIATVPPNNSFSSPTDVRIRLLDILNKWILESKSTGRVKEVVDLFSVCWNSSAPTTRVFKTNYSTDGVHVSNKAGLAAGKLGIEPIKNMYNLSKSISNRNNSYHNQLSIIGQMRNVQGVAPLMSYGTGNLAGGWRSLNNGSGTPTLVLDNTIPYTLSNNYVGPNAQMVGVEEKWQKLTITNSVLGSDIRLQLVTAIQAGSIDFGDSFYCSVDCLIESFTGIKQIAISATAFFTAGTSPVDIAYTNATNQARANIGVSSNAQTDYTFPEAFRALFTSEPVRIPENVNGSIPLTLMMYLDINFDAIGDAVVYFARPQICRKSY